MKVNRNVKLIKIQDNKSNCATNRNKVRCPTAFTVAELGHRTTRVAKLSRNYEPKWQQKKSEADQQIKNNEIILQKKSENEGIGKKKNENKRKTENELLGFSALFHVISYLFN